MYLKLLFLGFDGEKWSRNYFKIKPEMAVFGFEKFQVCLKSENISFEPEFEFLPFLVYFKRPTV